MKFFTSIFCVIAVCCLVNCRPDRKIPQTFLIKPDVLLKNKQAIQFGDEKLTKNLAALLLDAEKALSDGPYSVTFKSKVPPSGNKHDYMSVGPYWWPDSTKAGGLPYIRKDGEVNPERYEIKDAEYFKDLCKDVRTLSLACFYTSDAKYAEKAAGLLRVWFLDEETRMNPNLNYGQAIPGHTDGRGIGLIDTRATDELIDGIQLLKASNHLTADEYAALQNWFALYLDWMTTSPIGLDEADEHNNHGTYYDVQTVAIALFLQQPERAANMLENQTKARIESQLAEDGSQPHELARTQSWSYALMNLSGFFTLAALAENVNMDLWNYVSPGGKSIKSACLWMMPFAEGKPWPYQQIKPAKISDFDALSRIAAAKYPDVVSPSLAEGAPDTDPIFILTH
jgi:hypothetical protein